MTPDAPIPAAADNAAAPLAGWLRDRTVEVNAAWAGAGRVAARWSWARLSAFVLAAGGTFALRHWPGLAALYAVAAVLAFVFTVRRHNLARQGHESLGWLGRVLSESSRRCGGPVTLIRHNARPDDELTALAGEVTPDLAFPVIRLQEPAPPASSSQRLTGQECDDLDLFAAPVGLFGLLNRASTRIGELRLRDWLEAPLLDGATLRERQAAVRHLAECHDLRYALLGALAGMRGLDAQVAGFLRAADTAAPVLGAGVSWLLRIWSLVSFGLFLWSLRLLFAADWLVGMTLLMLLSGLNMGLLSLVWPGVRRRLRDWGRSIDAAREYLLIARQVVQHLPANATVPHLRDAMAQVCRRGALPGALRWMDWSTSGGMLHLLLNLYAFYDVHMLEGICRHVVPHRQALVRGLAVLAELEALLSLASFSAEQPRRCWPEWVDGRRLSIVGGCHPLIDPANGVPNDLCLDPGRNLWVITGSNMSGKSTLLRMAGVNLLLAQVGCAAAAGRMCFSPLRLITDLRIRDNLAKGESYFLAEVRQLRRMIVTDNQDGPGDATAVLGLIDEPFRGTNHQEQRAATLAVVEHLSRSGGLYLIATHDRRVADIAGSTGADNYHFREHLDGRQLRFDYVLRPGPAQTRNALRVLEAEDYPPDLLVRAHAWLDQPDASG